MSLGLLTWGKMLHWTIPLQGLRKVPNVPPTTPKIDMCCFYNKYCSASTVWQSAENVSGFLDQVCSLEDLTEAAKNLDDDMKRISALRADVVSIFRVRTARSVHEAGTG